MNGPSTPGQDEEHDVSDNFHFDLTGVGLDRALDIAFTGHSKCIGWSEGEVSDGGRVRKRLILHWTENVSATPLPAPMTATEVLPFVQAWLNAVPRGPEPDHDGDNGQGCRVYNEDWGHVGSDYTAFVAIEPRWLMYGK